MSGIKGVFFDLGGTLFSYQGLGEGSVSVLQRGVEKLGLAYDAKSMLPVYGQATKETNARYMKQSYYLHRDLFRDAFALFAERIGSRANDEICDWFDDTQRDMLVEHMVLREDCLHTLESLKERGLYLSIVSNIDDSYLFPLVEKWELHQVLDHWTSSEEAQSCKPHARFFEVALEKASLDAEHVLFVGDSPEHDVNGASQMGMKTALIGEQGAAPPLQTGAKTASPDHTIETLAELKALV